MTDSDTLAKALADVRERRVELQAEHERLTVELSKLRMAENSLAAIVEGAPSVEAEGLYGEAPHEGGRATRRGGGRGSRGPRANSAKGRLRALIESTGPQGLSQAEIARRLPDVAPATLNAYLSTMSSSGEILRDGDFYRGRPDAGRDDAHADGDDAHEDEDREEGEAED